MTIFKFAVKENSRHKVNLILVCLLPFPLLLIPVNEYAYPFGINLYGLLIFYTAYLLCRPMIEDRMKGVILRIAASPVSAFHYLSSHLAAYFLFIGTQVLLFIVGSSLVHRLDPVEYLYLFTLYLSFGAMSIALALAWSSVFRSFNVSFGLFAGVGSIICLLGGISIPLALFPPALRGYVMFLPTYWLPNGIEALYEGRYSGVRFAHAILLAYAAVFLVAGTRRRL